MDNTAISLYSQERMVCHLYSLAGPRTNLPELLTNLLGYDKKTILQKLKSEVLFTQQDLVKIQTDFKNAVLELGMTG